MIDGNPPGPQTPPGPAPNRSPGYEKKLRRGRSGDPRAAAAFLLGGEGARPGRVAAHKDGTPPRCAQVWPKQGSAPSWGRGGARATDPFQESIKQGMVPSRAQAPSPDRQPPICCWAARTIWPGSGELLQGGAFLLKRAGKQLGAGTTSARRAPRYVRAGAVGHSQHHHQVDRRQFSGRGQTPRGRPFRGKQLGDAQRGRARACSTGLSRKVGRARREFPRWNADGQ